MATGRTRSHAQATSQARRPAARKATWAKFGNRQSRTRLQFVLVTFYLYPPRACLTSSRPPGRGRFCVGSKAAGASTWPQSPPSVSWASWSARASSSWKKPPLSGHSSLGAQGQSPSRVLRRRPAWGDAAVRRRHSGRPQCAKSGRCREGEQEPTLTTLRATALNCLLFPENGDLSKFCAI